MKALKIRFFWIAALLITSCLFTVLTYDIVARFTSKQTVIRFSQERSYIGEEFYPAVTVCLEVSIYDKDGHFK